MVQEVMRNSNLSPEAKCIYAYLSSIAGMGGTCYPSLETMTRELNMSRNRLTKHMNQLLALGIVEKSRDRNGMRLSNNIYKITHKTEVAKDIKHIYEALQNEALENGALENEVLENQATNNNNININSINNNNKKNNVCPELESGAYRLSTNGIPEEGKRDTQVRIDKGSIVKGSIEKDVCPAPETPSQELSGILLPLVDKTQYNVPVSKMETWTEAYPAVDVRQELRKMIAWLEANPQRRKTRRGIDRFICTWLSREQDKGGRYRGGVPQEQVSVQQEKPEYYKYLGNTPPGRDDPFR